MGLIRRLREWREKVDGTLTGPGIETDSATVNGKTTTDALEAGSVNADNLDIGGRQIHPLRLDASISKDTGTEISHSFGSSVDHFAVFIETLEFNGDTSDILLRVDNDATGYSTRLTDGSEPTVSSGIKLSDEGLGVLSGWVWGLATGSNVMGFTGDLVNFDFQETMDQGKYDNDGVISSVQLLDSDGSSVRAANLDVFTIADY